MGANKDQVTLLGILAYLKKYWGGCFLVILGVFVCVFSVFWCNFGVFFV